MNYTPGPWRVTSRFVGPLEIVAGVELDDIVAMVAHHSFQTAQANAELIAAAPDLLAACESVMKAFTEFNKEHPTAGESECIALVRSAIAKATHTGDSREDHA